MRIPGCSSKVFINNKENSKVSWCKPQRSRKQDHTGKNTQLIICLVISLMTLQIKTPDKIFMQNYEIFQTGVELFSPIAAVSHAQMCTGVKAEMIRHVFLFECWTARVTPINPIAYANL